MLSPFTQRHRNTNYITSARFVNVFYHSSSTYTIIPCLSLNLRRSTAIIDHHLLSLLDASKIPLATCNLSAVPVHLCQVKWKIPVLAESRSTYLCETLATFQVLLLIRMLLLTRAVVTYVKRSYERKTRKGTDEKQMRSSLFFDDTCSGIVTAMFSAVLEPFTWRCARALWLMIIVARIRIDGRVTPLLTHHRVERNMVSAHPATSSFFFPRRILILSWLSDDWRARSVTTSFNRLQTLSLLPGPGKDDVRSRPGMIAWDRYDKWHLQTSCSWSCIVNYIKPRVPCRLVGILLYSEGRRVQEGWLIPIPIITMVLMSKRSQLLGRTAWMMLLYPYIEFIDTHFNILFIISIRTLMQCNLFPIRFTLYSFLQTRDWTHMMTW